jgi:hypothetical protein
MSNKLVPEIHDIGKLLDNKALGLFTEKDKRYNHTFSNSSFFNKHRIVPPDNKTWEGIRYHHEPKVINREIFLLKLADCLASGITRIGSKDLRANASLTRLWQQDWKIKEVNLLDKVEDVQKMMDFLKKEPLRAQAFFREYRKELANRPEALPTPSNLTGLKTHSEIVGKLYRFFDKYVPSDSYNFFGELVHTPSEARKRWRVRLLLCTIRIPQFIFRVRDLNIFSDLANLIKEFSTKDEVLLWTSNQLLLLLPPVSKEEQGNKATRQFLYKFLSKGFSIQIDEVIAPLRIAHPTPNLLKKRLDEWDKQRKVTSLKPVFYQTAIYEQETFERLSIGERELCEICQLAYATKKSPSDHVITKTNEEHTQCREIIKEGWPPKEGEICPECWKVLGDWIEQNTIDYLCEKCFERRKGDISFQKLRNWSKEPDKQVMWIKITLEVNEAGKILDELYDLYVKRIAKRWKRIPPLKFSVLAQLFDDYRAFLRRLNTKVITQFGTERVEQGFWKRGKDTENDLFCIQIDNLYEIIKFLRLYEEEFKKSFGIFYDPQQKENTPESPIKIGISCSQVKFPFFVHWRAISEPKTSLYIVLVGKGEVRANVNRLYEIMKFIKDLNVKITKTRLHRLAQIAEMSEKLADITVYDTEDKDKLVFEKLRREKIQPLGLDFSSILTLSKILGDVREKW